MQGRCFLLFACMKQSSIALQLVTAFQLTTISQATYQIALEEL